MTIPDLAAWVARLLVELARGRPTQVRRALHAAALELRALTPEAERRLALAVLHAAGVRSEDDPRERVQVELGPIAAWFLELCEWPKHHKVLEALADLAVQLHDRHPRVDRPLRLVEHQIRNNDNGKNPTT